MSFEDRLLPPAYISPSGIRQEFFYSSALEKSFDHKLDRYEFSDLDGTYFKDLGVTSDSLPLQFKFKGPDYDIDANAFEALLKEKGKGTLEHPIHGSKLVVVGSVRRIDDPVNAGGQAIFNVAFFESIELQPEQTDEFNAELANQKNELSNLASAASFAASLDVSTVFNEINIQETYSAYIQLVQGILSDIAAKQSEIAIAFNQGLGDILNNLDILIKTPLELAQQTQFLLQLPLQASESFQERFSAYSELLDGVLQLDGDGVSFLESREINTKLSNDVFIAELFGSAATNAIVQSASLTTYTIRTEALSATEGVNVEFTKLTTILDRIQTKYENEIFFDQYFSQSQNYNEMRTQLLIVLGDIQKRILDLAIEKRFTLKKDRHYIEVCGTEYNNIDDDTLQLFQDTNNIHGDDFFILRKGREIVVYV